MRQTKKSFTRALFSLSVLAAVALQQGCGGGGGSGGVGGSAPVAPTLGFAVQPIKTFHFTWKDVSNETEYRLMENPDGKSGYTKVATIPAGASQHDLTVSLPQRINARYMLLACNSNGCTNSNEVAVSGNLVEGIGYIKASVPKLDERFGISVALSADGTVMAVGTADEKVYLYTKSSDGWVEQDTVTASNEQAGDYFGRRIALSADGTVLAVGAEGEDGPDDGTVDDSGAVYVFSNNGGTWSEQDYIKASDAVANDKFGSSLALSADGKTIAVGTWRKSNSAGAAYVYTNNAGTWEPQTPPVASNAEAGDGFGYSVALSGDGRILAVGAIGEDGIDNLLNDSGAVYLFRDTGVSWTEDYIKPSDTAAGSFFGSGVAVSADGGTLAVSATGNGGAAYLFGVTDGAEQAVVTAWNAESNDMFGHALALSPDGHFLAVTSYSEDSSATGINGAQADNTAPDSGAVYLFSNIGGTWTPQAYIKASNTASADSFGNGIALSTAGATLAVGAFGDDGFDGPGFDSGAVYLY